MGNDANQIKEKLQNEGIPNTYSTPDKYKDHLLEQYKVYLKSAERISSQRQTTNSFFLTINTAIIALIGYVHLGSNSSEDFYWTVALAGIVLSYMWYRLIRSYRDLNTAKFKVIHEIEAILPICPFDAEWQAVGRGEKSNVYLPFTNIEVGIPWVFLTLHILVFIQSFPWINLIGK